VKIRLEELGDIRATADKEADLFAESSHREMGALGDGVKLAVRADIRKAKFRGAARLANAWRGKLFPRSPKAHAAKPAYVLGNNAEKILSTFETGATIKAKGGALMIPIGPAKRVKLPAFTPREKLPELVLRQYGVQRFVSQRLKKTRQLALGVFTAAEGGKRKFVPLFLLVKQVEAPDLLNAEKIIEDAGKSLPDRHFAGTMNRFNQALGREGRDAAIVTRVSVFG
jgi:hypothetical protein